jgi:hypothetical protein
MRDPRKTNNRDPSNNRIIRGVYKSIGILSEDTEQATKEQAKKRAVNGESIVEVMGQEVTP